VDLNFNGRLGFHTLRSGGSQGKRELGREKAGAHIGARRQWYGDRAAIQKVISRHLNIVRGDRPPQSLSASFRLLIREFKREELSAKSLGAVDQSRSSAEKKLREWPNEEPEFPRSASSWWPHLRRSEY